MTDSRLPDACAAIQPLLFAAIEGEVERDERLAVHAHLATCERCRSWERGERALTALLTDTGDAPKQETPSFRVRTRWAMFAAAAALFLLVTLPPANARGSAVERRLGPDNEWEISLERSFEDGHVFDVPAAAATSVVLGEHVRLEAVGPARFTVAARGSSWRVNVEHGSVVATIGGGATLHVGDDATVGNGAWTLSRNAFRRNDAGSRSPGSSAQGLSLEELTTKLNDGVSSFSRATPTILGGAPADQREHLAKAERLLTEVVGSGNATPELRRRALFYLAASLGRQGRDAESYELEKRYIEEFPDGEEAALVRHYMACHLLATGRRDEATALFEHNVREEGGSSVGSAASSYLESMKPGGANSAEALRAKRERETDGPAADGTVSTERAPARELDGDQGGYLVVQVGLDRERTDHAGFLAAADAARAFHDAETWSWDGADFDVLRAKIRARMPANVLFVLPPERLDLVLHRRVLLTSAAIDDDWFTDFAFGYLTAEDGEACERLWRRIERVHARGELDGTWWQASVAQVERSFASKNGAPPLAVQAGFQGPHHYYGTSDPAALHYVERSFDTIGEASVVEFTGCGDPQGIWLFDDHRNLERDLHWDYAPDLVGHDPKGEMPRLLASRFRELELDAPVLWSGTCHSGAVRRVYVEGDIVSTFGRTEAATVHVLEPESSLALSWIEAGAASLLVPLGANHGMSVSMEIDFALRNGASLGETIKSTYDDVLFAARGALELDIPVEGEPHLRGEQVMQGGGSNRILIGDPALRPFRSVEGAAERVVVERTVDGLRVDVERAKGWQSRAWDMFGTDRERDYRVITRVDLTELGLEDVTRFVATATATSPDGEAMNYTIRRCAIEDHRGRRFLHLQANGTRAELDREAARIVFDVVAHR